MSAMIYKRSLDFINLLNTFFGNKNPDMLGLHTLIHIIILTKTIFLCFPFIELFIDMSIFIGS